MRILLTVTTLLFFNTYIFAQNVGVDVASPVEKLDVLGAIRIGNTSNTNAGAIRWNSPNFQGYDGTQWVNFGGGTITGSGTTNYHSKWTSATNLGNSILYDNGFNLGIGTTSPNNNAELVGTNNTVNFGILKTGNNWIELFAGTTAGGTGTGIIFDNTSFFRINSSAIRQNSSPSELLRLTNSGNLGVGITNPSGKISAGSAFGNKLLAYDDGTNAAGLGIQSGVLQMFTSNNTSNIVFGYGSSGSFTENVRFMGTGNVGIGSTNPSQKLDVAGTTRTTNFQMTGGTPVTNQVLTSIDNSGNASWEPVPGDNLGDHTATQNIELNDNWLSNDGGSEGIRVDNSGNIGIGLVPGSIYLDITGTNAGTTSLQLRSGNIQNSSTSNQIVFGYHGSENFRHAIKTRHNSIGIDGNAIDFYVWKQGTDASGTIGTQHVLTIDGGNTGSVGIGTTIPGAQLHTTGTVRFAGLTGASQTTAVMADGSGNLSTRALNAVAFTGTLANHTPGTGLSGSIYDGTAAQTWSVSYGTSAGNAVQGNQTATITAGAGLTGGISADALGDGFSSTLTVGAGTGIVVNADDIALATIGTAGTYKSVTTDAYGRVTAGTNPTTLAGYGITDAAPLSGGANYIQINTVGNDFATGQATSFDITGNAEIGGTLEIGSTVGIGTTSNSNGAMLDVVRTGNLGRIRVSGESSGYTQADILLQTATTDAPEVRGTGIYTQNQGNNTTWYIGNPYNNPEQFVINRKTGTAGLLLETADNIGSGVSNYFKILSDGKVGIGRTPSTNRLEVEGDASKTSTGAWSANSDQRLKKNIIYLSPDNMLEKLLEMKGVKYEWNDDKTGAKRPTGEQYGFIAQDLQKVWPSKVKEDGLGYLQTAYGDYDFMFVESIKALHNRVKSLEAENAYLKSKNNTLETDVNSVKAEIETMKSFLFGQTTK